MQILYHAKHSINLQRIEETKEIVCLCFDRRVLKETQHISSMALIVVVGDSNNVAAQFIEQ